MKAIYYIIKVIGNIIDMTKIYYLSYVHIQVDIFWSPPHKLKHELSFYWQEVELNNCTPLLVTATKESLHYLQYVRW